MNRIIANAIKNLKDGEGLTLRKGEIKTYKSGWQVATEGQETPDPMIAFMLVGSYHGDCGVWLSEGIYYIDKCRRVNTKREALAIGKAHKQISVYGWKLGNLAYCERD